MISSALCRRRFSGLCRLCPLRVDSWVLSLLNRVEPHARLWQIELCSSSPAFFLWAGKYTVATRQDATWAVKNGTFSVTTVPAKPGDVIILWGTGFGPTTPAAPVGVQVPNDKLYAVNGVTVTIDNQPVQVFGTALSPGFAGLYQVAIQVPAALPDGDWPVIATVAGVPSPTGILLAVHK